MVIEAEFYPPTGLKHHGSAYTEEYYQNPHKSYAHIEDYSKEDFYNNSSQSSIPMRPTAYITTPHAPTKHGLVSHEGYAYQDNSYGAHAPTHKAHDGHSYGKYLNGMNDGEGYYTQQLPQGYYGHEGHGKGKHMSGMHHNGSYETQQYESYTNMGPNRYEFASYDYHGEPPYNHKHKKNWAGAAAEWISKGC